MPIRMALATAPANLDPRYATDAVSERINQLLYQSLVVFGENTRVIPQLADWQQLSARHYRFTLKSDIVHFSDGSRLTAQDIKATYDSILDATTASPHRGALAHIASIQVLNEQTLDFKLTRDDALFPALLAIGILPANKIAAHHNFNLQPIGNGVMRFVRRPDDNSLMLRRRRDQQAIHFFRVSDPTVRVLKLLKGEVDLLQNDLPAELQSYLKKQPGIWSGGSPGTTFSYIGFNFQDPLLRNKTIRQAIAHAIDRAAIVKYLFADNAQLAESVLVPTHWAGHNGLMAYAYDPEQAKALLKQAGFSQQNPLHLTFKTSSDAFRLRLISVLQAQLAEVGVQLTIRSYDWGTYFGDIKKGNFQLYSLSWVGIKSPDVFRYIFSSESLPPGGANRGRYVSAVVDDLLTQASVETDPGQLVYLYRQIQQQVHDDLVYIPLWYENNTFFARKEISAYDLDFAGSYLSLNKIKREPYE